jgi:hypothetical protein
VFASADKAHLIVRQATRVRSDGSPIETVSAFYALTRGPSRWKFFAFSDITIPAWLKPATREKQPLPLVHWTNRFRPRPDRSSRLDAHRHWMAAPYTRTGIERLSGDLSLVLGHDSRLVRPVFRAHTPMPVTAMTGSTGQPDQESMSSTTISTRLPRIGGSSSDDGRRITCLLSFRERSQLHRRRTERG